MKANPSHSEESMQDGIEDIGSFGESSKLKAYLRRVFYIDPIVREFRGYVLDIGSGVGSYLERYPGSSLGIDAHENNITICQEKRLM